MKTFSFTGPNPSNLWASAKGASVTAFSIWVSPLVKSPDPWTLGRYLTEDDKGLISSNSLPSGLIFS